ncbi:immunity protein Imm33 domain-containing protein [Agrococcus casei]|uniref:immunity protein Imm33 domain-containing protein n=1 Tax=Agrococcus casei TaxID=343512 RepID=UPI003F8EE2F3
MNETTTITRQAGEHTLRATATAQFSQMVEDILDVLEGQQANLRDGYVLQFGWGPIFLEAEDDALRLRTPDYSRDAANDRTEDLSGAIAIQVSQMWLPRAANVRPMGLRFDQEILIQRGWRERTDFEASRRISKHEIFSGWFICDTTDRGEPYPHDEIEKVEAWEVVQHRPELSQVLALPADTLTILLDREIYRVIKLDGEDDNELLYENTDEA